MARMPDTKMTIQFCDEDRELLSEIAGLLRGLQPDLLTRAIGKEIAKVAGKQIKSTPRSTRL